MTTQKDKLERKSARDCDSLWSLLENSMGIVLISCCIFALKVAATLRSGSKKGAVGA